MRITDSDGDLTRAAGVLIEFVQGRPIVVDLAHYRELVKGAPSNRTHDDLEAKATAAAKEKRTGRASNIDVAWFLVYGLLGADQDKSPLLPVGGAIARIAAGGCGWSSTSCASSPRIRRWWPSASASATRRCAS